MNKIWQHPEIPAWANFITRGCYYILVTENKPSFMSSRWVNSSGGRWQILNSNFSYLFNGKCDYSECIIERPVAENVILQNEDTGSALTEAEQAIWDEAILATLPRAFDAYSTAAKPEAVIEYAAKYADALIKARRSIKV